MFGGFGMWELVMILLVVLLLFGARRLPEIGSSLGKGIREFKGSIREIEGDLTVPEEKPKVSRAAAPKEEKDEGAGGEPRRPTTSQ